jgi:hypothetical protein
MARPSAKKPLIVRSGISRGAPKVQKSKGARYGVAYYVGESAVEVRLVPPKAPGSATASVGS